MGIKRENEYFSYMCRKQLKNREEMKNSESEIIKPEKENETCKKESTMYQLKN